MISGLIHNIKNIHCKHEDSFVKKDIDYVLLKPTYDYLRLVITINLVIPFFNHAGGG